MAVWLQSRDLAMEEQEVVATPSVVHVQLPKSFIYLLLATDGLTNALSADEVGAAGARCQFFAFQAHIMLAFRLQPTPSNPFWYFCSVSSFSLLCVPYFCASQYHFRLYLGRTSG